MVTAALLLGCTNPLQRDTEELLRAQLISAHRRELTAVAPGRVVELARDPSEVEAQLSPQRREELDRISGLAAYRDVPLQLGESLMAGLESDRVQISLQQVIDQTVRNNLDVQVARMGPAVSQTRITQAEAAFDAVFFTNVDFQTLDTPQPSGAIPGLSDNQQEQNFNLTTGIRKRLVTGGQLSADTQINRQERDPTFLAVNRFYTSSVTLTATQPLLRNFGSDINRANIVIERLTRQDAVETLRASLLDTVAQAETAYWDLAFAYAALKIQQRLLDRTIVDYNRLKRRERFDASPVEITEAGSFVELRRSDLIRARQDVHQRSDTLKQLINSPDLPVSGETLLVPVDVPVDGALEFSLLDSVTTALRHRPEMNRALLSIKDASIRQRVADNQRLPLLDIAASVTWNGLDEREPADAFSDLGEGDFIDYILQAQFEMPIGNRAAEALYEQRQIERRAAVLTYQRTAQEVVLAVKSALREVQTAYELIGSTRAARRAAADNLRALEAQEEAGVALTPQFLLNQKLTAQSRLADAEVQEVDALRRYNVAISELYRVMGTLLQRNGIRFEPDPGTLASAGRRR